MRQPPPAGIAHVKGLPVLGSLIPLRRDALEFFSAVLREHGDRVQFRILGRTVLLLCHPRDIESVLVRDRDAYGRSVEIRKLRPIFGDGLLASEGERWRRQRMLIQPSFQPGALARYSAIMLATLAESTRAWRAGEIRDIHGEMMKYTRETICRVLFGDEFAASRPEVAAAVSIVFGDLRSEILYLPVWRRFPLPRVRRWNRAVDLIDRAIEDAILARRASGAKRDDLLQALLAARGPAGESMTDRQIHDETLTFFLAGHETAALSLTWAAYLLALNPDVQQRLGQEVRSVAHGRDLTPEDYPKLRWTGAVVKEAMRLYPSVWSMGRVAVADTELGGSPVARGTDVWICLYRLHRDARWFPEPDRFMPERWLANHSQAPFTYLPFGVGERVCIGQRFAMMEAVFGIATLMSRFRLTLAGDQPACLSAWITLRPKNPILLRLASSA
jgi:cytochrome P450